MFGLLDRFYVRRWNRLPPKSDWKWFPKIIDGSSREVWYCFVPGSVWNNFSLKKNLLPQRGRKVIYTSSYRNMIFADAKKTRDIFEEIYLDARKRLVKDFKQGKRINLLGISLGNIVSVRLAHEVPGLEIENFVSIVGGLHPGKIAWNSLATRKLVRKGNKTEGSYRKVFSEFSASEFSQGLKAGKIFARFGRFDLVIPYRHYGKELKDALRNSDAEIKNIRTYWWADHVTSIFLASKEKIYDKLK